MKVSVIVPIYKVENEIIRCLSSVVNQAYKNIELILVNDCTPDRSYELALEYLNNICTPMHITYIEHEVNKGLSEARNSGIREASGDYLFFLDSDDELMNESTIQDLVELVSSNNCPEVVMGSFKKIYPEGSGDIYPLQEHFYKINDEVFEAYLATKLWMTAWGKLISRKFLFEHSLFFEKGIYHEDELWSFLLFRRLNTLYVTSLPVYKYYEREGSITSQITIKNVIDLITILEKMYEDYNLRKDYYPKETLLFLSRLRRSYFRMLMQFEDKKIVFREVKRLKKIKVPILSRSTSIMRFNLFMLLPSPLELFLR